MKRVAILTLFLLGAVCQADCPQPTPGDLILKDFRFASQETAK